MNPFLLVIFLSCLVWCASFYLYFLKKSISLKLLVFMPLLVNFVLIVLVALFFNDDKCLSIIILLVVDVSVIMGAMILNYLFSNIDKDTS
jgi:hypothetical protein